VAGEEHSGECTWFNDFERWIDKFLVRMLDRYPHIPVPETMNDPEGRYMGIPIRNVHGERCTVCNVWGSGKIAQAICWYRVGVEIAKTGKMEGL